MEDTTAWILAPIVQCGFAGFCCVLLGCLIWLIKALLKAFANNGRIVEANTLAIQTLTTSTKDESRLLQKVHDLLLQRPCLMTNGPRRYGIAGVDGPGDP